MASNDKYEYQEISDDEKFRIVQHYLLSSPPGQIKEVLKDIKKIVPSHILSHEKVLKVFHDYNTKSFLPVEISEGNEKLVICKSGEVDGSHYIDSQGKRVFGFDHLNQKITEAESKPLPESLITSYEEHRLSVESKLMEYMKNQYMNQGGYGVYVHGDSLNIVLSCERINLRNFWSGRWKSTWTIDIHEASTILNGEINLHVHYFENGNLQLQSTKKIEESINFIDPESLGRNIVEVIRTQDDIIQQNLEEMYVNMSMETFKEMRRVMPVTQTKMDWNVNLHRTAKNINK